MRGTRGGAGVEVWEVECILDERGDDAAKEYLIHWRGWAAEHDPWQSASTILDDTLIGDFKARRDADRLAAEQAARDERYKALRA